MEKSKRAPAHPPKRVDGDSDGDVVFVTQFRHWRSGKLIRAADYGLKAFPLRRRR